MNVGEGGGDDEVMVDINTTPLIDVMLVLLIMLIITIPIQTHAVKLNMPVNSHNTPPPDQPTEVNVYVDFDGTITWNGEVVKDRGDLQLRLYRVAQMPVQPDLKVRPNKLVTYKYVAEVMAEAQRLGVTKIALAGNEQYMH
jgi:biopolymer transport protein ExbD